MPKRQTHSKKKASSKRSKHTHTSSRTSKSSRMQVVKAAYQHRYTQLVLRWFIGPALLYSVLFFLMQPHYFGNFSDGFYLDAGDGFQNVWNIWWVDHALIEKDTHPYFTTSLHWPHGTSLLPQTMNIFNGLVGIPLTHVLGFSLVEVVNFAVLFSFIFGGITMLWFIYKLYHRYWVALLAGAWFTFSSFHFAHAQGHLQLVSLEFIPLFLLAFWTLLEKMRYRYALLAAGALFLVLLCDYYYFFWSVLLGGMWTMWQLWKRELTISRYHIKVLGLFVIAVLILCGPLVFSLMDLNKHDPLTGSHDPTAFSLDPLSVIMPGGSWYWHSLTDAYTAKLPYLAESSVFFGFALLILVGIAFVRQFIVKHYSLPTPSFWWIVCIVFGVLALGPNLRTLGGRTLDSIPLPYTFLEKIFPTLEISGMPVRWVLVSLIAAIIIASWVLAQLDLKNRNVRLFVAGIVILSLIDLWPRALPLSPTAFQPYVHFLQSQPYGAVIDDGALSGSEQLYNQTLHEKPIAFGYVTRLPKSVDEKDFHIFAALAEKRYDQLCKTYKVRYVTLPVSRPLKDTNYPVIYNDQRTLIYDFKNSPNC